MTAPDPVNELYPAAIWQAFMQPKHVGVLTDAAIGARVSDPLTLTELALGVQVRDGRIAAAAFKARGCPYTIGVLDLFLAECIGQRLQDVGFDARLWSTRFCVPTERLTRLLLIDSAWRELQAQST